ncbi:MAG: PilZ domain-containing protein [Gammaproteobacteria bacterium]|nr:PilZ domain-containing protein [Gammaproteobacteria bacterium]
MGINERRDSRRIHVERNVILNADRIAPQFCKMRNLSTTGAYIEVPENSLRRDMEVRLIVTVPSASEQGIAKIEHWPAKVVRVTEKGIGVELGDLDVEAMGTVLSMVYSN